MALVNNKELAKKIEYIKRKGTKDYIEKQLERNPFANSACLSLEGKGDFFYTGSMSFGVGFGMEDSLAKRDVEQIEEFIRNKKGISHARFELTPFCDPLLLALLQEQRYTLEQFLAVWVLDLKAWKPVEKSFSGNTVEIAVVANEDSFEWAWTVALGISKDNTVSEETMEATRTFLEVPGNTGFLLKDNGESAAGGTLAIDGRLGELFLASTVQAYQGKGHQNRLIEERIRYAKEKGCTHITVTTEPNTVSARNMEKNGFGLIYNKAILRSPEIK
ncbi:GNAT family N-acetyltransferase [Planococcus sp. N064]|uniref:GNAT family N-acetyltransferase n=1 Tax=Planococcus liqunii TaxID=3058394 RepID=A0ABT8MLE7_9BACL|nr:GNAT family N-acetyltransferase [Planococcus sp. N064]MDN7225688.1 GNAT family N-acetyltransferase [Planococcus sp. N064]